MEHSMSKYVNKAEMLRALMQENEELRKQLAAAQQWIDALKEMGWAAEINGVHFRRFDDWLPDDDCYDSGTLVKLYALPVSEDEAQAEREVIAAQAKQGGAA